MNKLEIRKVVLEKRYSMSTQDCFNISEQIKQLFLKHFDIDNKIIHVYLPIISKNEIDTHNIINHLKKNNCKIVLSKSNFKNFTLKNYIWDSSTILNVNKYGISEPQNGKEITNKEIDFVIVPLVSFDIEGNRLGYGKGFYDRFMSELSPSCIKIGLSHFEALEDLLPIDSKDIRLDYCVSPTRVYTFN
jgi:5-formyltetrahydrofolate cyclo-ligase